MYFLTNINKNDHLWNSSWNGVETTFVYHVVIQFSQDTYKNLPMQWSAYLGGKREWYNANVICSV